eukprot:jgi/Botrbrau1/4115/Bobra.152_3s0062.1
MAFSYRPPLQAQRPVGVSWKPTSHLYNIARARIPRRVPVADVFCQEGRGTRRSNDHPFEVQRCMKAAVGLASPLVNTATACAAVVVTPDCPAEPEPLVQLLLAALIIGSLFKLKQIFLHENPLDTVQDEKLLVARAKARHREFLNREPAGVATDTPFKFPEISDASARFMEVLAEVSGWVSALRVGASRPQGDNAADQRFWQISGMSQRPADILKPLFWWRALPLYKDKVGQASAEIARLGRNGVESILSPFKATWPASASAAAASDKGIFGGYTSTASTALPSTTDDLPNVSPVWNQSRPGSVPGKFAVAATAVVREAEPEVVQETEAPSATPQYPALEELFLRSPDELVQEAAPPAPQAPPQPAGDQQPLQQRSRRMRRDPADYVAGTPATSRARAMLQLEKDRLPSPAAPLTSKAQQVVTESRPADGVPKTFRRTLDLPEGFQRAVPARAARATPTPAQMAKSRSMANLREENGTRIRGASSRAQPRSMAMAEDPQTRAAAYKAKVADLWQAAERRQQEETRKMRARELRLMQSMPSSMVQPQIQPWTPESSDVVREAINTIRKPGAWAFVSSIWNGVWSNVAHGVTSRRSRPRMQRAMGF